MVAGSTTTSTIAVCRLGTQRPVFGSLPGLQKQQRFPSTNGISTSQSRRINVSESRRVVQAHAVQELYEVADVAGFVGGTAATMFAMTLVGLAIGFVLLRFEALVEEGKI